MIEREEQVAELAKDLLEAEDTRCLCECNECCFDGIDEQGFLCTHYSIAHFLYHEKGYRKTNTTDTVLTVEEHKAFLKDLLTAQKATAERVRTETAREILRQFGNCDNDEARYKLWCDLCELYGMEVEE